MKLAQVRCVYVIFNKDVNITKIGVASDVKNRLSSIKHGCGCEMELVYNTTLMENFFEIETKAHQHFSDRRRYGEWFDITPEEAILFLESIQDDFIDDEILSDFEELGSLDSVAKKHKVSRQAVSQRISRIKGAETVVDGKIRSRKHQMTIDRFISEYSPLKSLSGLKRVDKDKYYDKESGYCFKLKRDGSRFNIIDVDFFYEEEIEKKKIENKIPDKVKGYEIISSLQTYTRIAPNQYKDKDGNVIDIIFKNGYFYKKIDK